MESDRVSEPYEASVDDDDDDDCLEQYDNYLEKFDDGIGELFGGDDPGFVYEALLGTLYANLVFKEGSDWKFGTGTRNVDRNEPHDFRFLFWRDATRRHKDPRRRGKASARAIVAAVDAAFDVFQHIPCFSAEKPGTTLVKSS